MNWSRPTDSGSIENARLENRKLFKILFKLLYLRSPSLQTRTCVFRYLHFPPLHSRTYVFRTCIFHPPVLSFSVLAFSVAPTSFHAMYKGNERGRFYIQNLDRPHPTANRTGYGSQPDPGHIRIRIVIRSTPRQHGRAGGPRLCPLGLRSASARRYLYAGRPARCFEADYNRAPCRNTSR